MDELIKLVLEDGTVFPGKSFGKNRSVSGEVVFSTGMMGYPESLTDPSFRGQILVMTYPLVGNYGVPDNAIEKGISQNLESDKVHITALIVSDYSKEYSHWSAKKSLSEWLIENDVPGIYGIDTRALTKKLREKGVMLGKIVYDEDIEITDPNARNLVADVSVSRPVIYGKDKTKILLIDCGAKHNIIRSLLERHVTVTRVPWDFDIFNVEFHGIVISNGPGDPKMCTATIANVKKAMERKFPIFGICLGNQILSLAAGGNTYKLKYGHRSQNQPCIDKNTKKCYITSQNHGFAVDMKTLSSDWKEWFVNANDGTNEGIIHKSGLFMSVQYHPEACPGPVDTDCLFDNFIKLVKR